MQTILLPPRSGLCATAEERHFGRPEVSESLLTAAKDGAKTHSTMARVNFVFSEGTPLYQQVAAEIRRSIAEGEARPGERMPLAKDLATVLGVNTNTVLRALRELRDEGLLEFRRGRGITVAGTPERGVVMARVKELVAFARQQGYQPAEVIAMIEAVS
jgi:GntR family transcriptional regulator